MTVVLAAVAVIMAVATAFMFGTMSRLDTAFTDIGNIKAEVAKVATATEFMRSDLSEIKTTLKSIDQKFASAGPQSPATRSVMVKDFGIFAEYVKAKGLKDGIFVSPVNPSDLAILTKSPGVTIVPTRP